MVVLRRRRRRRRRGKERVDNDNLGVRKAEEEKEVGEGERIEKMMMRGNSTTRSVNFSTASSSLSSTSPHSSSSSRSKTKKNRRVRSSQKKITMWCGGTTSCSGKDVSQQKQQHGLVSSLSSVSITPRQLHKLHQQNQHHHLIHELSACSSRGTARAHHKNNKLFSRMAVGCHNHRHDHHKVRSAYSSSSQSKSRYSTASCPMMSIRSNNTITLSNNSKRDRATDMNMNKSRSRSCLSSGITKSTRSLGIRSATRHGWIVVMHADPPNASSSSHIAADMEAEETIAHGNGNSNINTNKVSADTTTTRYENGSSQNSSGSTNNNTINLTKAAWKSSSSAAAASFSAFQPTLKRLVLLISITSVLSMIFASNRVMEWQQLKQVVVAKMKLFTSVSSGALSSAGAGLAAGCLHTLAGPDHLAALAPLSIGRTRSVSMLLGALWGGGHTTGQLLIGALIVLFHDSVSKVLPLLSRYGGIAVGLTLVTIGLMGYLETKSGDDNHEQDTTKDAAIDNTATTATTTTTTTNTTNNRWFATYATGIVYGFHPDAVMMIVPALALPSQLAIVCYILAFCMGTVLAMGGYTGCIGATSNMLSKKVPKINNVLALASSFIAVALGVALTVAGLLGVDIGL